jgi:DNA modification methylase
MLFKNNIFYKSSEKMSVLRDESVDLIVTSPPYNIDIRYGNKWNNRKITSTKSSKYQKENYLLITKSFKC